MTPPSPSAHASNRRANRRIAIVAGTLAATLPFAAAAAAAATDDGRSGATAKVQPSLGVPANNLRLLGTTGTETWAYGTIGGVAATVDGGTRLPATPQTDPDADPPVFVVHRPGQGWSVADEPRSADGRPIPFLPLGLSDASVFADGSMHTSGAAAVLGNTFSELGGADPTLTPGVLVRDPGGTFRLAPSPSSAVAALSLLSNASAPAMLTPLDEQQVGLDQDSPSAPASSPAAVTTPAAVDSPDRLSTAPTTPEATTPSNLDTSVVGLRSQVDGESPTTPSEDPVPPSPASTLTEPTSGTDATPATTPSAGDTAVAEAAAGTTPVPAAGTSPDPAVTGIAAPAITTDPAAIPTDTAVPPTTPAAPLGPTAPSAPNAVSRAGGSDELLPTEHLFSEDRRIVLAVQEANGRGGALVGVVNDGTVEDSVFHYDGNRWVREPVLLSTTLQRDSFRLVALAGTSLSNAWLLARSGPASGAGIVLFRRDADGVWRQRSLAPSPYASARPVGTGVTGIAPLAQPGQPLTISQSGLWIDGSFTQGGTTYPFTIFYNSTTRAVTGHWCDAPVATVCGRRLNAGLDTTKGQGYRSFAWGGRGAYGQRIITNPQRARGLTGTAEGTRLTLQGVNFVRVPGLGIGGPDAAFTDPQEGAILAPGTGGGSAIVSVTASPTPDRLQNWPVPARRPLLAVTSEPGKSVGAEDASALAAGLDGAVARYLPGQGWTAESLTNQDGIRQRPTLRGVAWPEAGRAHAVGDDGAMWLWRGATGLWEPDPSRPLDFYANLMAVAFQPGNPSRGYAVGRQGTLLSYGKSWTQEALPKSVDGMDLLSVGFAGNRAYVVWRDPSNASRSGLLVNDGGAWTEDTGVAEALADTLDAKLTIVAGLPDGGVIAGGDGIVLKREGSSSPWIRTATPPTGVTPIALAPIRENGTLRAIISAYTPPGGHYPVGEVLPPTLPGDSPQLLAPVAPPISGVVMRESASGTWSDETHRQFPADTKSVELPADDDQVYALSIDPTSAKGWAVGGLVVRTDADSEVGSKDDKARRRAAAAFRYPADPNAPAPQTGTSSIDLSAPVARLAIGGHASCVAQTCADRSNLRIAADVGLTAALGAASKLGQQVGGPRAFIYTGPRVTNATLSAAEANRFAATARAVPGLPFFAAPGRDSLGEGRPAYAAAFKDFARPFGLGAQPLNVIAPGALQGTAPPTGARNHYTFDSAGAAGTVRVIVIDNAAGSLAAADPQNIPADPSQQQWLISALDDAKRAHVPAIVIGNRDLNSQTSAQDNLAADADPIAQLLVDHGASAYFYDAPNINRTARIPGGATVAASIPQIGTGTLGRGSSPPSTSSQEYYGEAGYLLTEVDVAKTDATTNVAPVRVRLIPVLAELSLDPSDGTLIRRSRTARFQALGRRPRMGGVDSYQSFPPTNCQAFFCAGRIEPEYRFVSSNPDIADFVQQDVRAFDDRAVLNDASGSPIRSSTSGLLCAFNAGTTTVSVEAGGLKYSQKITVQGGAVSQPCGTAKLVNPPTNPATEVDTPAIDPPSIEPNQTPNAADAIPVAFPPPPAIAPAVPPAPPAAPVPAPAPNPAPFATAFIPLALLPTTVAPPSVPPPPSVARPLPPPGITGVSQPVSQVEEKREEEQAFESSQAYAVAEPAGQGRAIGGGMLMGILLLAAGAGSIGVSSRRRPKIKIAQARNHWDSQAHARNRPRRR